MYQYLLLILLLQWRLTVCTSSPTLEDNMLPTDEQVISDLINSYRRGQPEEEIALNLPTDEEAFNEIKPILQSGNPFYYINGGGRFISSSFPGMLFFRQPHPSHHFASDAPGSVTFWCKSFFLLLCLLFARLSLALNYIFGDD